MIDATTQRTLYSIRENLSSTLSKVLRGPSSSTRHVAMNSRGEVLSGRSGTWSIEPRRFFLRLICLSYAAMSDLSIAA